MEFLLFGRSGITFSCATKETGCVVTVFERGFGVDGKLERSKRSLSWSWGSLYIHGREEALTRDQHGIFCIFIFVCHIPPTFTQWAIRMIVLLHITY